MQCSDKKKVVVIDGQGGKLGKLIVETIKKEDMICDIYAIGTNSIATAAMLKADADYAATGENPVVVACRDADVIIGPIGITCADAMLGEITPVMAMAVGQSRAKKMLIPMNNCDNIVVGVKNATMTELVNEAVGNLKKIFV